MNEATIKITGVSRKTLIGTDFSDYFTDPSSAREGYVEAFSKGSVTDYPLTIRHKDGRLTDVLYNATVYRDASGSVLGVFAAARDVTDSRRAEQRFRTLIESAPDAIVLASRDGTILLVNDQTEILFGYDRGEILGKPVEILVPNRNRNAHPGHRAKFFAEPRPRPMGVGLDLWGIRKDGSEFPIEISLSPIESPQGLTVAATIRDVTLQKTASQYARSLIEASLDPLVTISPEGKITDVNEGSIKVTGMPRENLVGTDFSDYFTEPEKAREGYQQVFAAKRILIVEDERVVARDIQRTLTDLGYDVPATVATAEDAIRLVSERCPDLVLMDIQIKGNRDGVETAAILRSRFDVPVVYLTAYADAATVERVKATEPLGYLLKPVKATQLHGVVGLTLYRHAMEKRLRERERWFSTTLHSIADAVITVDLAGNVTFINAAAETLIGLKAGDAIGKSAGDVLRLVDQRPTTSDATPLATVLRTEQGTQLDEGLVLNLTTGARGG